MDFSNKRVLITGGTGSFGNKVASYLERFNPKEIIIFSRDEKKQYEMKRVRPNYRYILGDIRDFDQTDFAVKTADIIFHASALKQVPSCESQPFEAVKTNIIGSENLCRCAIKNGIEKVVALSTDKAVKPINAMGISKAMMEKIICSQNNTQNDTIFCCVRYGNVMGSRGSVIPLFLRQIAEKEHLTVTDPKMTRFLLTLDQSVELVHFAFVNSKGGEIFVKKAPACSVQSLAEAMLIKHSDGDLSRIRVTGVRPGEKVDEVLVNEYEIQRCEETHDFFKILSELDRPNSAATYPLGYEYTSANTLQLRDPSEISALLDQMGQTEFYT
jgi:UDP-N-acetylglucosamine 4,6-dehydratase